MIADYRLMVGDLRSKNILKSWHLLLIKGIIGISVVTTTIIDYQFKTIASEVFLTDNSLTTFMGRFYGRVSMVAFFFQLFLSSKCIDRRGVGVAAILVFGSVGVVDLTGTGSRGTTAWS